MIPSASPWLSIRGRLGRASATLALSIAALSGAWAAPAGLSSSVAVDWQAGDIRAQAALDIATAGIRLPSGRLEAERRLDAAMPDIARDVILGITVDSHRTVRDTLEDGSLDGAAFERFLESGRRSGASLNRELTRLEAAYEWRLADLASLYVRHSVALGPSAPDRYAPTRAYSGIVIYVKGELQVRGEHRAARLEPSLFPRIYDSTMRPVLDRNLVQPEALRAWGPVAFVSSLDAAAIAERAGGDPLRIIASQVFGSRRTDVVISAEDARKILASAANVELVRQGRVVIVLDETRR